jgi:hypothetical protein
LRIRSSLAAVLSLFLCLGCGGGGGDDDNSPPASIEVTAFFPGTPLPSDVDSAFAVYGVGFLGAGDPVGTTVIVRFRATSGTPFLGGLSETLETTGELVSTNQLVGVVPAALIPSGTVGPVPAIVEVDLPLGGPASSVTPLALFAPLRPEITDFLPSTPLPGVAPTPFTVLGSGLGPVGGTAQVTFTALGGQFCGLGTSFTVDGLIATDQTITGVTPGGGVSGDLGALVTVVLPGGAADGFVIATFLAAPGAGTFVDRFDGLQGDHPTTVSLGDLNGDMHLDMLVANGGGGPGSNLAVFLNDGAGALAPAGTFTTDTAAHRATLGDLDGDHDLDCVVVYYASATPNVWLNDGTGVFTPFGDSLGMLPALCVELADMDGDEDLDILMGMDTGGGNRVFLNDGAAGFSEGGFFQTVSRTSAIAVADVDGDEDLDVFAADGGDVALFLNDGSGVLVDSPQSFVSTALVSGLMAGDVDGDGDPDLAVVQILGGTRVYLNEAGAFIDSGQVLGDASGSVTEGVSGAMGDIDGDCDLDLVLGNGPGFDIFDPFSMEGDGRNTVWRNGGSGAFSDSGQRLGSTSVFTSDVALGDLNGDGDLELVTIEGSFVGIHVYDNP